MTNTSMSAVVDTLPAAQSNEGNVTETLVDVQVEGNAGDRNGKHDDAMAGVTSMEKPDGEENADVTMGDATTAAEGTTLDIAEGPPDSTAPAEDDDDPIIPPESPPALRRSSRRPAPLGTSLSVVHRATRSSASPTPSTSSIDPEELERRRFKPILADLDGVKQMLRDRANEDWLDSLRSRGTHNAGGSREGVSMVSGRGVLTKETEAVEDFLYAIKVGGEFWPQR
jgi:hypothetical protein